MDNSYIQAYAKRNELLHSEPGIGGHFYRFVRDSISGNLIYLICNFVCSDKIRTKIYIVLITRNISIKFQAALLQRWLLPHFMCAFCPFVQILSVNVSVFTLTAIAIDRHRAILKPLRCVNLSKR